MIPAEDRRRRLDAARLYLVSPARLRAGRLDELVPHFARAGIDMVQLRDRSLSGAELRATARACADASTASGILFIVNDDPVLARVTGADGVHVGQDDGDTAGVRRAVGHDRLIGRSTRGGAQLATAAAEKADYVSVGPIWETPTKPGRPATGLRAAAHARRMAELPWFAVGGIDERTISRVGAIGARRVAVVRAIVDAEDPVSVVRLLRRRLEDAVPRVLSVAGTDSSGGAGLLADTKAITHAGGYPLCAVAAVTAQSTVRVAAITPIPAQMVASQVMLAAADIGVDAIKTGVLTRPATIEAVADAVADPALADVPLVVDPVLRAESGAPLTTAAGLDAYRRLLLPLATVITPNLTEAQALSDLDVDDPTTLARALFERFGCAVIVTGGHGERTSDTLVDVDGVVEIPGERHDVPTTHGAGCTHSATLAAMLARGEPLVDAAIAAKRAAAAAVAGGRYLGIGAGPVDVTRVPRTGRSPHGAVSTHDARSGIPGGPPTGP